MIERTFVMLKPDAMQRGLVGEIVGRLEGKGLKPVAMKLMRLPKELAESALRRAQGQGLLPRADRIHHLRAGAVHGLGGGERRRVGQGDDGQDQSAGRVAGNDQGRPGQQTGRNLVHGSDSLESAKREIGIFFNDYELQDWKRSVDSWLFE